MIGKGNKQRSVPISDFAQDYLEKYLSRSPGARKRVILALCFPQSPAAGKPLSRQYFFMQVKKYAKQAGHRNLDLAPYLRHCFATHLLGERRLA
jgi:integrase/recombinase XerD